ncbi:orf82 [Lactobacillus phage LP65]|uniref:Orf82 n=1 Tax=Lactobacillus phage LP65 TaxID=2892344 RepID=Q5ULN2_9CAUD|nr:hypothetical protein LP65_gp082 [Lactobacillus phage LP65]AAV35902.1 orf82 [Lactobacillus phage LP65]
MSEERIYFGIIKTTNAVFKKCFMHQITFYDNDLVINEDSLSKLNELCNDVYLVQDLKMIDFIKYLDKNLNINRYKHKTFYDMPADYQGIENIKGHTNSKPVFQHDTVSEFPPIPLGFSDDDNFDTQYGSKELMERIKSLSIGDIELRKELV